MDSGVIVSKTTHKQDPRDIERTNKLLNADYETYDSYN